MRRSTTKSKLRETPPGSPQQGILAVVNIGKSAFLSPGKGVFFRENLEKRVVNYGTDSEASSREVTPRIKSSVYAQSKCAVNLAPTETTWASVVKGNAAINTPTEATTWASVVKTGNANNKPAVIFSASKSGMVEERKWIEDMKALSLGDANIEPVNKPEVRVLSAQGFTAGHDQKSLLLSEQARGTNGLQDFVVPTISSAHSSYDSLQLQFKMEL